MSKNPFSLSFGRKPFEYIDRFSDEQRIFDTFTEMPVTDQVFVIMGVRGTGKTVAMTEITDRIGELDDWIVLKISPLDDITDALFKMLYNNRKVHKICLDARIDFSFLGVNVSVENKDIGYNLNDMINQILEQLQKKNIKVLVAIDEVTNTPQMQRFASAFQLFITDNRPLYFLATGLYDEIDSLRNVHNLTFLYRAPRVNLSPLNLGAIADKYKRVFDISTQESVEMARETKGYSFAFQTLGYVTWEHKGEEILSTDIISEYDQRLSEASYSKLWSELSVTDKKVCRVIAKDEGGHVSDFREKLDMDTNYFNQYRRRLKAQGLIDTSTYGCISFTLPRFAHFILTETY